MKKKYIARNLSKEQAVLRASQEWQALVLGGIPVFLVRYGIKFRPVLLYKDTVSRCFN